METKQCPKCKHFKKFSEFYKYKRGKNGLQSYCKTCTQQYNQSERAKAADKKYAQSEKGKVARLKSVLRYHIGHPEQRKAVHAVNNAIATGKLPRPDTLQCHYCDAQAEQYHHWHGYAPEHWLDVIPVCSECHQKYKRRIA